MPRQRCGRGVQRRGTNADLRADDRADPRGRVQSVLLRHRRNGIAAVWVASGSQTAPRTAAGGEVSLRKLRFRLSGGDRALIDAERPERQVRAYLHSTPAELVGAHGAVSTGAAVAGSRGEQRRAARTRPHPPSASPRAARLPATVRLVRCAPRSWTRTGAFRIRCRPSKRAPIDSGRWTHRSGIGCRGGAVSPPWSSATLWTTRSGFRTPVRRSPPLFRRARYWRG